MNNINLPLNFPFPNGTPRRVQLHGIFESLLGSKNVYFQPPEKLKLEYPCICYSRNAGRTKFANDKPYNYRVGYQVIVVDKNPDSETPGKIAALPMCSFERHYTADNLNHDVYNLYY